MLEEAMEKHRILSKIKPSVKLFDYIWDAPRIIASAGKQTLSPKEFSEIYEKMNKDKTIKWITELVRRGHGSPLEHSIYIFEITCSRVASHQLVRHRIASYTQLSQRYNDKYLRNMIMLAATKLGYKNVEKNNIGKYIKILEETIDSNLSFWNLLEIIGEAFIIPPKIVELSNEEFLRQLLRSVKTYYSLINNGVSYEDARFILPQAVKTRVLVSMNARELLESFLPLRMCSHAQWEIRYIAWQLWRQLVKIHPEIFSYAGPRCVYMENRVRPQPCTLNEYVNGKCEFTITRCPELVPREGIRKCINYASRDLWNDIGDETIDTQ
ncbi:FAD-dependent thymidylate synthase [Staphylothermus hellenicus]|uniref:Flavin-dependent thymidylate synthase n=1 Tax=Staphylothermus hellenicus (strain DSM 12710 / JCM 10830 / BK20S6-10-b1 / P8) TaxID=591019 RepID=D7D9P2_STAHD|nr:FAD-dependent thymidylate synthase [Staphylothermus hellenicus]ADI32488.1 thymidylate synthase, flavin-dependent [Staphylothermus hellenicus DSM 12710]